ncbi:MAG: hypothetical protein H0W88_07540 [Parachlamydiaceae bacterium]|nr:hypothetical protein [Parachlamydiaceae bacterium]
MNWITIKRYIFQSCCMTFFLPTFSLYSIEDTNVHEEQLAEAYYAAYAYDTSALFYEKILNNSPSDWKNNIALYNLGTIRIEQNRFEDALKTFNSISLDSISIPILIPSIMMQQGLVYYRQANFIGPLNQDIDVDESLFLLQKSINYFEEAKKAGCQIQKLEDSSQICVIPHELAYYSKQAAYFQRQIQQKQVQALFEKATFFDNVIYIKNGIRNLLEFIEAIPQKQINDSYLSYLHEEAQYLMRLWDKIEMKDSSPENGLKIAYKNFSESLNKLKKGSLEEAIKGLRTSNNILQMLLFQSNKNTLHEIALRELLIDYQIIVTHNKLTPESIQKLIEKQINLKFKSINLATQYLNESLKELQGNNPWFAKFYLFASYYNLQDKLIKKNKLSNSSQILQKSLQEGRRALQLDRLAFLEDATKKSTTDLDQIILGYLNKALNYKPLFLQSVMQEQEAHFRVLGNPKSKISRCQKGPWNQVIPLFEHGYKEGKNALHVLAKKDIKNGFFIVKQSQMVKLWEKALKVLQNPSKQLEQTFIPPNQMPKDIQEVFQSLQEMELNDTLRSSQPMKEIIEW